MQAPVLYEELKYMKILMVECIVHAFTGGD